MDNLTTFLAGYKTYVAAAGLGLLALAHFANGDLAGAGTLLMQALGLFGLRAALANQQSPPAQEESPPPAVDEK